MPSQPAIHWIGAGLASGPGIISLAKKWGSVTVWDMTLDRAEALKAHLPQNTRLNVRSLNLDNADSRTEFCETLNPGDVIISMLPASFHVQMAKISLHKKCHMATSSYLSEEMIALNPEATAKGLSLVNEVGLDPGIDHLLTHILINSARTAGVLGQGHTIDFISYCGGIPAAQTPFNYKFSWTPLGVLTALSNPAIIIKNGQKHTVAKAWDEVTELSLHGEKFEVYANRNSLPYIAEYGLDKETNLRNFIRGTLRQSGWQKTWAPIFTILGKATPEDIRSLSKRLWQDHQYDKGEKDRVMLRVALTATSQKEKKWTASLSLDIVGTGWQSAMATAVSLTVAEAANALMNSRLPPGVQSAPHNITEVREWLKGLKQNGLDIKTVNINPPL